MTDIRTMKNRAQQRQAAKITDQGAGENVTSEKLRSACGILADEKLLFSTERIKLPPEPVETRQV